MMAKPRRLPTATFLVVLAAISTISSAAPGDAATDLKSLVQASRETGVLLATTSYIVVENSAQWRTLEASEKQKLGQNTALAFRETPAPPALWLAGAFIIYLVTRARKKRVPTDA